MIRHGPLSASRQQCSMFVIVRRLVVRGIAQLVMGVFMRIRAMRMRMRPIARTVRLAMFMLVVVRVLVDMAVRMTVHKIAMAMRVFVNVLVRMGVIVAVLRLRFRFL
jgi:hypothetical protein